MAEQRTELEQALYTCRSSFIAVAAFSMFINLLMLVPAFYMLQVYDRVVTSGSIPTLVMLTLVMLLLMATMGALEWVRSRILVRVSSRIDVLLGRRLYDVSFRQALYSGGAQESAQPLQDLNGLRQFLTGNALFSFFDAPWIPFYLIIMFLFHPWYGVVGILSLIILAALAVFNEKSTSAMLAEANREHLTTTQFTGRNLRNAEVVESMGMLDNIRAIWNGRHHRVLALQAQASDRAGIFTSISKTTRLVVQSLILGVGAYLAVHQEISPGLMIAGSILLGRALAPIDQMIGVWKQFVSARTQYQRLNALLARAPAPRERMSLPTPKGEISAENVLVGAPGSRSAIVKGASFKVAAGDIVGIIGPSASGKSTLARAILGIWPTLGGTLRLDGAEVYQWSREELGPHIGYLPQDIELFDGSVSDNIARFGKVDAEAVVEAAQLAGVHEMILRLPQGYDTVIGGSGGMLSGGQRQRIGLARTLYGHPRIVVLDEPNSNLDDQGEVALAEALQNLKQIGSTVFIITHRANVLSHVNKLMVMRDGLLALFGPRDEVLTKLSNSGQVSGATPASRRPASLAQ